MLLYAQVSLSSFVVIMFLQARQKHYTSLLTNSSMYQMHLAIFVSDQFGSLNIMFGVNLLLALVLYTT
ncbi:hypothetical protein EDC96DRAFT_512848 [Choanephora cucurbitarum]|nr:hypothetical protein EDC96DRAFT_512848 [Choanephora cucurbitarum]